VANLNVWQKIELITKRIKEPGDLHFVIIFAEGQWHDFISHYLVSYLDREMLIIDGDKTAGDVMNTVFTVTQLRQLREF